MPKASRWTAVFLLFAILVAGTHFFIDPKEKIAAVLMTQTSGREITYDFETAVMQAIIE